eukprot:3243905-Amphidinium_carterae.1
MVGYRTPGAPAPSEAETLVLDGTQDQEVEAPNGSYRTSGVPAPQVAETERSDEGHRTPSVPDEAQEPEAEADTHGSDMFAESEAVPLPPPPPLVARQHAACQKLQLWSHINFIVEMVSFVDYNLDSFETWIEE